MHKRGLVALTATAMLLLQAPVSAQLEFDYDGSATTEAFLDPPEPDGDNGWYVSAADFSIESDDEDAELQWRVYGDLDWIDYTAPVTLEEGENRLVYRDARPYDPWGHGPGGPIPGDELPVNEFVEVLEDRFARSLYLASAGGRVTFALLAGEHDIVVYDDAGTQVAAQQDLLDDEDRFAFSVEEEGDYTFSCLIQPDMDVELSVSYNPFAPGPAGVMEAPVDLTPPETFGAVHGPADGAEEAFAGQATVTMRSSDETSGVSETHVRQSGADAHEVYDGPFVVTKPGAHAFEYRSKDVAGNLEDWQHLEFVVDDAAPAPSIVCDARQGGATFPDAPGSGHQYFIDCLAELGVVEGYTDGTYGPADDVSRGQLATFVVRALEEVGVEMAADVSFPDVNAGSTHTEAISKLATASVVQGREDGTFAPEAPVTRAQTATYVAGAIELVIDAQLPAGNGTFPDVSGTHAVNIEKLVAASVLDGFPDGTFGPADPVTRGQMAKFIGSALEVLDQRGHPPQR